MTHTGNHGHRLLPVLCALVLLFCGLTAWPVSGLAEEEKQIQLLPLGGALQDPKAEISGLAWHRENLILLPQFPDWASIQRLEPASLFAISKADIVDFLLQDRPDLTTPLPMKEIQLRGMEFCRELPGFEGFEALAVLGDRAFLLIEAKEKGRMVGWLLQGIFSPDAASLWLEQDSLIRLEPPANLDNMSYESLVLGPGGILALFEANGRNVTPSSMALHFDFDLAPLPSIPFPAIEYRISDATTVDDEDRFWVLNVFWPGDKRLLKPGEDFVTRRWGEGSTHARSEAVERILGFEMTMDGPKLADEPPVELQLGMLPRNWEGLALLRDDEVQGFLMVSDKYPATMLGFIDFP